MLLNGHTRQTIDAMSSRDKHTIFLYCQSGLVGPMSSALQNARQLSMLEALRSTVISIVGGKTGKPTNFKDLAPELQMLLPDKPVDSVALDLLEKF